MGIAPSGSRRRQRRDWGRASISARPASATARQCPGRGCAGTAVTPQLPAQPRAQLVTARFACQQQGSRWAGSAGQRCSARALPVLAAAGAAPCPASRPAWGRARRSPALGHAAGLPAALRAPRCWWGNERHLKLPPKKKATGDLHF